MIGQPSLFDIVLCAGTRPNFMKIAPLYHEGIKRGHNMKILHTGQHYDNNLSGIFFKELGLPQPDINLEVSCNNREQQLEEIKKKSTKYFSDIDSDLIIVVGDVNSTLGCALGAKKANKKVAHVEAGLRSFDMEMPEEHNRIATDKIIDYKFVSEPDGIVNLKNVGLYNEENTFFVGNVMIDNVVAYQERIENAKPSDDILNDIETRKYLVATFHRPSNVDEKDRLKSILELLDRLSKDIKIVFPMHPRTRRNIESFSLNKMLGNILVTKPLGYIEFMKLVKDSKFVLTDSGGIQEETTYFGVPCITMRANTERPITISEGTSYLAGYDISLAQFLSNYLIRREQRDNPCDIELWDGKTASRIFDVLDKIL